jgi:hypothetical protein
MNLSELILISAIGMFTCASLSGQSKQTGFFVDNLRKCLKNVCNNGGWVGRSTAETRQRSVKEKPVPNSHNQILHEIRSKPNLK